MYINYDFTQVQVSKIKVNVVVLMVYVGVHCYVHPPQEKVFNHFTHMYHMDTGCSLNGYMT